MQIESVLVLSVLASGIFANGQGFNGAVRGVVEDSAGGRVRDASVELERRATSQRRDVRSDAHGEFRVDGLTPGQWKLRVTARTFAPATAEVDVSVSTTQDVTVTLRVASLQQSVAVSASNSSVSTQPIDLAGNVHQSVVSSHDLATLPLPTRSFANIAYLAPGTEPVEASDPTKARISAVSTGGSSGLNNELSIDGADDTDDFIGGFLQNVSPDAIHDFSIRTAQEDADTGGTTAGSVVITTKSGTNDLHGMAAFYDRAAAFNARYPIENPAPDPKQPFSRQNYVGNLGGPLVRDRLWFFADFEHVHENASIAYSPASTMQFESLASLAAAGLIPGVPSIDVPGSVTIPFRDYLGAARLDLKQSERSQWFLRGAADSYIIHNNLVQQGTLPSTGLLSHNNYLSLVVGSQFLFSPTLLGNLVLHAGGLHLTQSRNSDLGFAYAFPFSSTAQTISGFETFGDNQFATPITFFPLERNQEKYQLRYDMSDTLPGHALKFGIDLIHEPVLGGRFPDASETLYSLPENPSFYLSSPAQFAVDRAAGASPSGLDGGAFSQNLQRLAFYVQDSWRLRNLTLNYGLRYSTTLGLFNGSGRPQSQNPAFLTLAALDIPLVSSAPLDDRKQVAPRLGFAFAPGDSRSTIIRGGFGLYFDDLAQGGWATALQAVNTPSTPCIDPIRSSGASSAPGCVPGHSSGGSGNLIDPRYRTPYAIHVSGGMEHAFSTKWLLTADVVHEQGNHGYRAYSYTGGVNVLTPQLAPDDPRQGDFVPDINVFHSDNRSSYNGLLLHLQGAVSHRANVIANYTWAKAQTWGCVLGELFDYVNGVCDPLNAFAPGDYGPSGEDVRHRFVLAGNLKAPAGFEISGLTQAESARPFTITLADSSARISVNGVPTSLDEFRASPYIQTDLRVSRPFALGEGMSIVPFAEFFNLFNRNNPGANFVTNVAALPVPAAQAQAGDVHDLCSNADCSQTSPIQSLRQLGVPAGGLGDFFGPGTTVGIPFAMQIGVRVSF